MHVKICMCACIYVSEGISTQENVYERVFVVCRCTQVFPAGSDSEETACKAGDLGSISGLGRSSGEGNDHLLQLLALRIPWTEESGGP